MFCSIRIWKNIFQHLCIVQKIRSHRCTYIISEMNRNIPSSQFFLLVGLILGSALIIFVCVLSDECGSTGSPSSLTRPDATSANDDSTAKRSGYSYGWSFLLAVAAFLAAEASATLCLSAFLNRFESEVS